MRSDTAAACVLRFIGANKCVLDLGAGAGSITRPMVEQNGCHATAVELDETCIHELQSFCESVLRLDLNDHGWREVLHDRRFDAIVFADVLEHLYDPWKALELAATLLSEDGFLVASIPNSSHAAILGCLFSGEFEYRDTGLLDRTHIRFFGVRDIENLFRNAGLKIVDFAYVLRNPEDTELAASWSALPGRIQGLLESSEYAHV
jgi:2-polyprenyl-3-methyl-5-hydroxy-6-metoxy-1,4-benzoquinol methylase